MSCGLRDVANLEAAGLPTALIHTDAFDQAASRQAAMLGQPAMRRATVPHPVQDKTGDQIRDLARRSITQILGTLAT